MSANVEGLALVAWGFAALVAWLVWAIDSCDGGES